jgi:hypothetical protein
LKAQRGCPTLKLPAGGQPVQNFGIMLQKQVRIVQMHLLLLLIGVDSVSADHASKIYKGVEIELH